MSQLALDFSFLINFFLNRIIFLNQIIIFPRFYITFIDDYSRYTRVYLLRNKDEAMDDFVKHKNEVEDQLRKSRDLHPIGVENMSSTPSIPFMMNMELHMKPLFLIPLNLIE